MLRPRRHVRVSGSKFFWRGRRHLFRLPCQRAHRLFGIRLLAFSSARLRRRQRSQHAGATLRCCSWPCTRAFLSSRVDRRLGLPDSAGSNLPDPAGMPQPPRWPCLRPRPGRVGEPDAFLIWSQPARTATQPTATGLLHPDLLRFSAFQRIRRSVRCRRFEAARTSLSMK